MSENLYEQLESRVAKQLSQVLPVLESDCKLVVGEAFHRQMVYHGMVFSHPPVIVRAEPICAIMAFNDLTYETSEEVCAQFVEMGFMQTAPNVDVVYGVLVVQAKWYHSKGGE